MKGKDLIPWIIGIICSGVVIGILRGSGIILGGLPTALIAIGCVAVVGFIVKSVKKDNDESNNKSNEQSTSERDEMKISSTEKLDDEN